MFKYKKKGARVRTTHCGTSPYQEGIEGTVLGPGTTHNQPSFVKVELDNGAVLDFRACEIQKLLKSEDGVHMVKKIGHLTGDSIMELWKGQDGKTYLVIADEVVSEWEEKTE